MDKRRKELQRRFKVGFLSKYQREEKTETNAVIISTSSIMSMIEEVDPPFAVEMREANNLIAVNKFSFTRKEGEYWYFVKEILE